MKRLRTGIMFALLVAAVGGCGPCNPAIAAQRSVLHAVDGLHIADRAIVAAYPNIEGTDEERVMWLAKAVCALQISRDFLQIGWDVTFYWASDGKVCKLEGEVVPAGTEGATCTDGKKAWEDWIRISVPVVIHSLKLLQDFGVSIPDTVTSILTGLASTGEVDEESYDEDFTACVLALEGE